MEEAEQYTGTKTVTAFPMMHDGKDGYAVIYADGYRSWSPKDVFEATYKPSGTWQERLLIERDELSAKLDKLDEFLPSREFSNLPEDDRDAIEAQYGIMHSLRAVLNIRLANATPMGAE